jgi:fumarate hydratase subunit beta
MYNLIIMKNILLPANESLLSSLKAGDMVLISGTLLTARDAAHKKLFELMIKGEKLPVDIKGQIIYYVGPTPARPGKVIGSAGPTTSGRMDKYAPALLDIGLLGMIGKGRRSAKVVNAIIKNKAVYFAAVGGAGAYLSKRIKSSKIIAYPELGTEAVRQIEVNDFPVVVAIDSNGKMINSMR